MPEHFFTHAAPLHQSFLHCAISPTAASRRSLGRVSVPMWPSDLSVRLPIEALVGLYPANWLIGRGSIPYQVSLFTTYPCEYVVLCGLTVSFPTLSPCTGQVTHALLTRPPLRLLSSIRKLPSIISVRLACVRHAASVHPEPGSNSHINMFCFVMLLIFYFVKHSYPRVRISSLEIHLTRASSLSCFSSVRHHSLFIKCLPSSE